MLFLPSALSSALQSQKQEGLTAAPTCSSTRALSLWFKALSLWPAYIAGLCYNEISQKTFCKGHLLRPFPFCTYTKDLSFKEELKKNKNKEREWEWHSHTDTHSLPPPPRPAAAWCQDVHLGCEGGRGQPTSAEMAVTVNHAQ